MIWWKYLLVLVDSVVLFLKADDRIVIAKIVFLNKQTNIFFYLNTNWEVSMIWFCEILLSLSKSYVQKANEKNDFLQKWGISVQKLTKKK